MVRLRASRPIPVALAKYHFNSYMVRLRAAWRVHLWYLLNYFNSYMVRLRDESNQTRISNVLISIPIWFDWEQPTRRTMAGDSTFQFLYGSIESISSTVSNVVRDLFQFLYGSIESHRCFDSIFFAAVFQFLYGSIESLLNYICPSWVIIISIPIWFDWEIVVNIDVVLENIFQFLYGSIERRRNEVLQLNKWHFNSYMVRLRGYCRNYTGA